MYLSTSKALQTTSYVSVQILQKGQVAYSDADWAVDTTDGHRATSYCVSLSENGSLV